jgi:hypothetical protein
LGTGNPYYLYGLAARKAHFFGIEALVHPRSAWNRNSRKSERKGPQRLLRSMPLLRSVLFSFHHSTYFGKRMLAMAKTRASVGL